VAGVGSGGVAGFVDAGGDDWRLVGNKSGPTRPGFVTSAAASRRTPGAKPPAAPGRTDFSRSRRLS
jgi:hypothetical protein